MVGEGARLGSASTLSEKDGEGDREEVESPDWLAASGAGSLASAGRPKDSMSSGKEGRGDMAKRKGLGELVTLGRN